MEVSSNQASLPSEQRLSGDIIGPREERNSEILNEDDCCNKSKMKSTNTDSRQQMLYRKDGSIKRRHAAAASE